MGVDFNYPYLISADTPAVALEVQSNLDSLLAWIKTNYRQIDDSPLMTAQLTPPSEAGNDQQVVTKSYVDNNVLPTGTIIAWAGTALPNIDNWEWCRGANVSTTDPKYQPLFNIIGMTYGDPGGGRFSLPDLQGKFPLGVEPGTFDEGDTGGSTDVARHNHTATFAGNAVSSHSHTINHGHADTLTVNLGSGKELHDLELIMSNGGWPATDGNPGLLFGNTSIFSHSHGVGTTWPGPNPMSRLPIKSDGGTAYWDAAEVNPTVGGSVTNHSGNSGNGGGHTPAGTVTVNNNGDTNDNRPPWQAINYIIRL